MIVEICLSFDFYKDIDEDAYASWAKKAIIPLLKSPGVIEFRAHRNLFGSPQVRLTSVWKNLADWANFAESKEWLNLKSELNKEFATNMDISIWEASPIAPEPLRPAK